MDSSELNNPEIQKASQAAPDCPEERLFLYEIALPPTGGPRRRTGKVYLKVPSVRMSQEMRRIARWGGKILSIKPCHALGPRGEPEPSSLPWWLEIFTANPRCLYYFGPFEGAEEARSQQVGYLEDLQQEGAEGITVHLKQGHPSQLTQEWD